MSSIEVETAQNIRLELELASIGDRMMAFLTDLIIIIVYIFAVVIINTAFGLSLFDGVPWLGIIAMLPVIFYFLISEISFNGQSVGKKSRNIRVVSMDGNPPTFGQYLIRWLFRIVDISMTEGICAILCVALTKNHQRLGDIVAGTIVIKTVPNTSVNETLYVPVEELYTIQFPEVINLKEKDIQLIKEVLLRYGNSENLLPVQYTAEKIKETLQIQTGMDPLLFLHTILADYNYQASRI